MRTFLNWKAFLSTVTLIGAALFSATASATLTALPTADNPTTKVVTIGVMLAGYARGGYIPLGDVSFTEAGHTLGVVSVGSGCPGGPSDPMTCTVRLALAPGFATGRHTITAFYSGDQPHGSNPPESLTFTVYVSELAWLPGVLDLLSH